MYVALILAQGPGDQKDDTKCQGLIWLQDWC